MHTLEPTPKQRTARKTTPTVESDGSALMNDVRPWSVMHATEHVRGVLELAEAQRDAGMRPVLVTPEGYGSIELYLRTPRVDESKVSLLSTWQEVRQWRKSLADCAGAAAMDIVHAHCFAAGMSGVRNWPAVVYDLRGCVEHDAEESQQWLARSLRVAEQFVLTRAQAVVVHWPSMRAAALERGTPDEHIFVIPDPVTVRAYANSGHANGDVKDDDDDYSTGDYARDAWPQSVGLPPGVITFFATDVHAADFDLLLSAFTQLISEENPGIDNVVLLLEADAASEALRNKLAPAGISRAVRLLTPQQRAGALRGADVVLTGEAGAVGANAAGLEAMRAGRAVLAADTTSNRDLSPEGRGCLWYKPGDARDLAGRASFLARNPDFRRALGHAAREYLTETRSPAAVARQYDAAYRHAFARRRDESQNPFGRLQPLHAAV
jgi:glycosyltransferase involved in cell wall biosynthesis